MRALSAIVCAGLLLMVAHNKISSAAVEPAARATPMEVLVFEHPGCTYCPAFRRDLAATYALSTSAADAPVRYIDLAKSDIDGLHLKARIDMVPTVVVMKDGEEVGRIAGYWGRDNFLKMLSHIVNSAQ